MCYMEAFYYYAVGCVFPQMTKVAGEHSSSPDGVIRPEYVSKDSGVTWGDSDALANLLLDGARLRALFGKLSLEHNVSIGGLLPCTGRDVHSCTF